MEDLEQSIRRERRPQKGKNRECQETYKKKAGGLITGFSGWTIFLDSKKGHGRRSHAKENQEP